MFFKVGQSFQPCDLIRKSIEGTELHQEGIYACATLRAYRKRFPNDLKEVVRRGFSERGESETCHCTFDTNLTVSVWQDTKPVTTGFQSVPLDEVQRKLNSRQKPFVSCRALKPIIYTWEE